MKNMEGIANRNKISKRHSEEKRLRSERRDMPADSTLNYHMWYGMDRRLSERRNSKRRPSNA